MQLSSGQGMVRRHRVSMGMINILNYVYTQLSFFNETGIYGTAQQRLYTSSIFIKCSYSKEKWGIILRGTEERNSSSSTLFELSQEIQAGRNSHFHCCYFSHNWQMEVRMLGISDFFLILGISRASRQLLSLFVLEHKGLINSFKTDHK